MAQTSGPGKYPGSGPWNTIWGTAPFSHWEEKSVSSSVHARSTSNVEKPHAAKALSQFHW